MGIVEEAFKKDLKLISVIYLVVLVVTWFIGYAAYCIFLAK
jgi:phage shock protein PspC (stress-responsive transcriptional regulator)